MNWKDIFKEEKEKPYYKKITEFLEEEAKTYTIYPKREDIFNAFKLTQFDEVKVVILGMDPYINENQAHGLSFSVLPGNPIPPSLKNIFKELKSDLVFNPPNHGCLIDWAKQGVLLLNSALTVRSGESGSHSKIGWHKFTDSIISRLNERNSPQVFMLWGSHARSKKELINNPNHLILEAVHPSPLSAHQGWFGCKHFSKANDFLIKNNIAPINWELNGL